MPKILEHDINEIPYLIFTQRYQIFLYFDNSERLDIYEIFLVFALMKIKYH